MTKVHLQPGLRGLSGSMGDWVYSMRKGKTVLGMKAICTAEPSEAQVAHRARFKQAASFAKSAMAAPALRAVYEPIAQARDISIFALAVADFLNVPEFQSTELSNYKGQIGDTILFQATDDIGLAYVNVQISAQDGTPIESGPAIEQGTGSGRWIYTATAPVALGTDIFIEAIGADHAGTRIQISENPTVGQDQQ